MNLLEWLNAEEEKADQPLSDEIEERLLAELCPHCGGDDGVLAERKLGLYACLSCIAAIHVGGKPTHRGIALWWAKDPEGKWVHGTRMVHRQGRGRWIFPEDPNEEWEKVHG